MYTEISRSVSCQNKVNFIRCSQQLCFFTANNFVQFTYSHFLESLARPRGFRIVPVETDDMGIRPKALAETLHQLKTAENLIPKLLYVIPSGQNPTGSMSSVDRIKEIYLICQKYGIFIIEDDPYCLLQFPLGEILKNTSFDQDKVQNSGIEEIFRMMPGIDGIGKVPSYLSIDEYGIVIRLDSFSKILAPGFRVGWVTAESCIIDKFSMAMQSLTIGASHLSQCLIFAIVRDVFVLEYNNLPYLLNTG